MCEVYTNCWLRMFHGAEVISGGFEHDPVMIPQLSRRLVKEIDEEAYSLAVSVGLQRPSSTIIRIIVSN